MKATGTDTDWEDCSGFDCDWVGCGGWFKSSLKIKSSWLVRKPIYDSKQVNFKYENCQFNKIIKKLKHQFIPNSLDGFKLYLSIINCKNCMSNLYSFTWNCLRKMRNKCFIRFGFAGCWLVIVNEGIAMSYIFFILYVFIIIFIYVYIYY